MFLPRGPIAWLVMTLFALAMSAIYRSAAAGTMPGATIFVDNLNYVTAYPTGSSGDVAPLALTTDMISPSAIARDASGRIYVSNTPLNSITIYPAGASGNVPPLAVIAGAQTQLAQPIGIAVDGFGRIYVLNSATSALTVYPPLGAGTGILDEAPAATISGNATMLDGPVAIALDRSGNIYVANQGGGPATLGSSYAPGVITTYPAGSNGNVAPSAMTIGGATGLVDPVAITVDSSGNIYVANQGANIFLESGRPPHTDQTQEYVYPPTITVYSSGSVGNATPGAIISGSATGLTTINGIALDSMRDIYVTNVTTNANSIEVHAAGSDGNVSPMATIAGNNAGLNSANGMVLDSAGNLYVSNKNGGSDNRGSINVYPAGSNGDAEPSDIITSNLSGIDGGSGIAVDSSGNIYVANLFSSSIGIYPAGGYASGPPTATIAGGNTGLYYPLALALDANRDLAVLNDNNTITLYASGRTGNAEPERTLNIDRPKHNFPVGIAMGADGTLYVANESNCAAKICRGNIFGSISIFAPGSRGNARAERAISGPDTRLGFPRAIAVDIQKRIYCNE